MRLRLTRAKPIKQHLCFGNSSRTIFPFVHTQNPAPCSTYFAISFCRSAFFQGVSWQPEPDPPSVLPVEQTPEAFGPRLLDLARPRLGFLAAQSDTWWLEPRPFFDVERQRIWILWRQVLHSAHDRTQLTVYLRLLDKKVVSTYGPTADVCWAGADPTLTV
jgi:hypothetical protein